MDGEGVPAEVLTSSSNLVQSDKVCPKIVLVLLQNGTLLYLHSSIYDETLREERLCVEESRWKNTLDFYLKKGAFMEMCSYQYTSFGVSEKCEKEGSFKCPWI
ncbi:hypothetical protein AVEN_261518-1 [Araneus ventricosus]|uniref:Uncharacterized protein n=1 Tax=Araneus ventricosus TaxID=182803 RepID=A0A4Y2SMS7_ARAVE|nr:hypothetical protein AVEN_261518-1 [Araneus ventricosus]